jgi:hypothetical protein
VPCSNSFQTGGQSVIGLLKLERGRRKGREDERACILLRLHNSFSGMTAALFAIGSVKESLEAEGSPQAEVLSKAHQLLIGAFEELADVLSAEKAERRESSKSQNK